jgi:hypothetical protein
MSSRHSAHDAVDVSGIWQCHASVLASLALNATVESPARCFLVDVEGLFGQ